jgi:hypothetical protein
VIFFFLQNKKNAKIKCVIEAKGTLCLGLIYGYNLFQIVDIDFQTTPDNEFFYTIFYLSSLTLKEHFLFQLGR